ncbi:MAG: hypothetical protein LC721_07555, partial [Actinobacteria bacterium]|nr:hypothetical protein [Actinomycetota bacterium]
MCAPPVAPAFHPHTPYEIVIIRERARYVGADRAPIGYSCWAGSTTVHRLEQAAQAVLLHTAPTALPPLRQVHRLDPAQAPRTLGWRAGVVTPSSRDAGLRPRTAP